MSNKSLSILMIYIRKFGFVYVLYTFSNFSVQKYKDFLINPRKT